MKFFSLLDDVISLIFPKISLGCDKSVLKHEDSTLESCAHTLQQIKGIKVSIVTIAIA